MVQQGLQPLNTLLQTAPPQTYQAVPAQTPTLVPIPAPAQAYSPDQTQWNQVSAQGIPATYAPQPQALQYQQPQPAVQYQPPAPPVQYQDPNATYYAQQQQIQAQQAAPPVQYQDPNAAYYAQQQVQYQQQPVQYQQPAAYPSYAVTQEPVEYKKGGFPLSHTLGGAALGAVIGSRWKSKPILGAVIGGAIGLTIGTISQN